MATSDVSKLLTEHIKKDEQDMKHIRENINNINITTAEMKKDIVFIRKSIEGNGKPGLIDQVYDNTQWRSKIVGGLTLLSLAVGYGLIKLV